MNKHLSTLILCATLSLSVVALNGCQTAIEGKDSVITDNYFDEMHQRLAKVEDLSLSGRLGIITATERVSAFFSYDAHKDTFTLELASTFGSQLGVLTVNKDISVLKANNKVYKDKDPRNLLLTNFNIDVPVSMLKKIFLGIPDGDVVKDSNNQVLSTNVAGYDINYSSYQEFNGYALPTQMTVKNELNTIKLKVNEVTEIK